MRGSHSLIRAQLDIFRLDYPDTIMVHRMESALSNAGKESIFVLTLTFTIESSMTLVKKVYCNYRHLKQNRVFFKDSVLLYGPVLPQ